MTASLPLELARIHKIRPETGQHGFSKAEVSELMQGIYQRGDRIMLGFLVAHSALALALAAYHQTYLSAILVSVVSTGGFWLLVHFWPRTLFTRSMASIAQQAFVALHIYQMHGQPEQHFWFFTALTLMIVYQDWVCMWPGTLLIILQHVVFAILTNMGYQVMFFPEHHVDFTKLFFHFGIAIVHVALCGYFAVLLRRETLSEAWQRLQLTLAGEQKKALMEAQRLESLGLLAGGVAHDFNNLLMVIIGNAELAARRDATAEETQESVEEIKSAAHRAAELTRQMLAYSGRADLTVQPVNLSNVASDMASLLGSVISKKATVRYDLAPGLPLVEGDATQIGQVVMNLITNASDALGENAGEIVLSTGVDGGSVFVQVSDTGHGMDAETVQRVFDPFFTTKFTGRGLGLASVQGIVRGHGGTIQVTSKPGVGSTFRVLFPQAARPGRPLERVVPPAAHASENGGHGRTILVADDEPQVRRVAERALERAGYSVITAQDGQEALDRFRAHRGVISLVLLDMTMPTMNGAEACVAIRELAPEIPVIICSGYVGDDFAVSVRDLPDVSFLAKPYEVASLYRAVKCALGEAATLAG